MKNEEILARLNEIQRLKKDLNKIFTPTVVISEKPTITKHSMFKPGISIIIPTYKGENVILTCLNSLHNQTLKQDFFEVIIIINGEKDSTETIVNEFIINKKMNNIRVIYSAEASASSARNIGIKHAQREYTVFLDDDDYLSNNFLEEMFRYAAKDVTVVSQIVNVAENGSLEESNPINKQIIDAEKNEQNDFRTLNMVATINACKLVPTEVLKDVQYDSKLKSGEDVVFFMELFVKNNLKFKIIPIAKKAIYYRILRENSVSRQAMTFEFYIKQRLDVIAGLNDLLLLTTDVNKQTFIKQKINAQSSFINRYLKENTQERENAFNEIKKYNLSYIPYPIINRGVAEKLIIAYCFPPYVDTSGNVMAKRIRHSGEVVDVVYNKMDNVRELDNRLNLLVDDLIEDRIEIPSYPSFSNWKAINDFCTLGMSKINKNKNYNEIYSRAMWPGSHFLAYQYKKLNPKVKWTAEFSDPLLLDIHGKRRDAKIDDPSFIKNANKWIKKRFNLPAVEDNNLFFWSEYLPYLFADELIFTNENQLRYMKESFPIKKVRDIIKRKAVISPHPTLPKEHYFFKESPYQFDKEKVNIAYFGTFYQTRNLDDLFVGLEQLNEQVRKLVNLHIFTANPALLQEDLKGSKIEDLVKVNPYMSYYEFLNLTTQFDCLVVNDAATKESKPYNPYLPSKLSDYLGSGTKIWGIYEEKSILSEYSLPFKSELGNIEQATRVFEQVVNQKKKILLPV